MHTTAILSTALLAATALTAPTSNLANLHSNSTAPTASTPATNPDLLTALQLAPVAADRIALLTDSQFKYDFLSPPSGATTTGLGGRTVRADRRDFPALIGTGVSMTVGFIGPCGFNTPHTHPRSSEINIIVQGRLGTEFQAENGARSISDELKQYQMTVFPQGALHTEFNPGCEDAVFVARFASEDPGVLQAAQSFFGLQGDLVKAALQVENIDGKDLEEFRELIPKNVALGVEQCLKTCGIPKNYKK